MPCQSPVFSGTKPVRFINLRRINCRSWHQPSAQMNAEDNVVVEIPQGKLRGKKEKSILGTEFYSFQRIPYAKQPVGELRFKAPQPAEKWTGVLDATKEGSVCPSSDWTRVHFLPESKEGSLFINVFCKQNPKEAGQKRLPVMVWIHGGGFEFGSGNKSEAGPEYFMLHDVILVTFNYRLGVLGFLSLQTVDCPGNFGLKDQQLALKWVKSNIGFFGGDPDNITLFGISAGAGSVHFQLLALSNEGLFDRAIAQSGSSLNRWAIARKPRECAFALGRRLGCDTKDDKVLLEFLKKAPVEDLVLKNVKIMDEVEGEHLGEWFLNFAFVPTVEPEHEGAFLTKHPWVLLKEGKYLDVPLILGFTEREMILGVKDPDDYPRLTTMEEFQRLIPRDIQLQKNGERSLAIAKSIKEFYFKNGITLDAYIDVLSDSFFTYGVMKVASRRTTNKNIKSPTYLYEFVYDGGQQLLKGLLDLHIPGAAHGDDTSYMFTSPLSNMDRMAPGLPDHRVMMKLSGLWTRFATSGVPYLEELGFSWPPTSSERLEYLEMGERFVSKEGLARDRLQLWDEIYTCYYDN